MTDCCTNNADDCFGDACPHHPQAQAVADTQADALARLRALRQWHYKALTRSRTLARQAVSSDQIRRYNSEADEHLHFVQSLNGFFPSDDAAA